MRTAAGHGPIPPDGRGERPSARGGGRISRFLRLRAWMLRRTVMRLENTMFERTRYSQPKMVAIGMVGAASMLIYYPVWVYLFPQPYENLWLRLGMFTLFLPLALVRWWPRASRSYLPTYWYTVMTLAMPFFCGYMMLRNLTPAWMMTHLVVVMLLMMLFDVASFLLVFITGSVLAAITYLLSAHGPFPLMEMLDYAPLLFFALAGGAVCSVSSTMAEQSQVDALTAASNNIAHELRTPLGSLRISAQALRRYLPDLLRSHHLAQSARLPVTQLRGPHLSALERSLDVMDREVSYANTVIDMLLLAARPIGEVPFAATSMRHCVEQSLARYPYGSRDERERVRLAGDGDFLFNGSETLVVHIVFNLLRNALYHTGRIGKGEIELRIEPGDVHHRLVVRDTGPGIPPDVMPRIFNRFFSYAGDQRGVAGLGIGLAFARAAMERMDGDITCRSRWGEYTEFTLIFPPAEGAGTP